MGSAKRTKFAPLAEALLLTLAALAGRTAALEMIVPIVLALAMGVQNTVLRRSGRLSIALTYLTGTMVRFGRAVASAICQDAGWKKAIPYLGVWLAFVCGAVTGAQATGWNGTGALLVPALLLTALAVWHPA
jgi:uncharacterized membrane protein YoaK (UPF0700 family)